MLEQLDLSLSLPKTEYKALVDKQGYRLNELQRLCKQAGIPVMVVFEGWGAAGKGSAINRLMRSMDPRGCKMHSVQVPTREAKLRPYLWRYAVRTPPRGVLAIYDRSWYTRVLKDRVEKLVPEHEWLESYEEIEHFERQLVDDNFVLIKFFLHISKKEQKQRFHRMEKDSLEAWKVTPEDWEQHRKYGKYKMAVEDMLQKTSTAKAPWTLVEAENKYYARLKIFETLVRALEQALADHERRAKIPKQFGVPDDAEKYTTAVLKYRNFLGRFDLTQRVEHAEYKTKLKEYQKKARQLHHRMYLERMATVAVFQGWDAAGKGGAIRRLVAQLDPRGFDVVPIAAPTKNELMHHYLWRFWKEIPKAGHLTIFDRSWYGRVMVERIEGFCTTDEWQRAYKEINEFEKILHNAGIVILKYWLQIDKDEQLARFKAREETPHKKWKIVDEDWRNREKWDDYELAVSEMIQKTSTTYAPWTVIEANDKLFARLKVLRTFIEQVEGGLRDTRLKAPKSR